MDSKKYYISTAIAYTSGKPHIGNTYEIVLADAIARYKRADGFDVYFQTGTDEHGQKIQEKAAAAGVTPQAFVDDVAGEIKRIWDLMNTSYDKFVRTTNDHHKSVVQKIFKKLYEQGDIYKGAYEGKYCTPCESFFTESQLVDGKCPDCGREVKDAKEEAYFLKMSNYADRLMQHIEDHPEFIQPESRKNEMVNNFLKPGLQDLCVSRTSFNWGVPVTIDEGHVVYVWVDALSNYITFLGYDIDGNHSDEYKKYWPCDVHLIGKDILRFHTIYWPIILMALGEELPKQVFGHPWLMVGDGKMSKSVGNVLYADDLVDEFSVDAVRYFVLHEIPFANDGVITYELLVERINSDLANVLGNLVNRTITMSHKYFGGVVTNPKATGEFDEEIIALCESTLANVRKKMDELKVADAIDEIFALLRRSNKYIDETMPWALAKDEANHDRLRTVLYNLLECIRVAAILLKPYLPETSDKILAQLNLENDGFESIVNFGGIAEGHVLGTASILFERLDMAKKLAEIEAKKAPVEPEEPKTPEIVFDDFTKVEILTAKVLECEPVKKSDKLLKFKLDVGGHERQILSGIAKWHNPADLIGKTVLIVANLAPRKMMGQMSEGMLLSSDLPDGSCKLLTLDDSIPSGMRIG
ncbi:MAG: methionine--tRNA ligase [Clostridia bacterium]